MSSSATQHHAIEAGAFLTDLVANQPRGKEIHVVAGNLSAHKSQLLKISSRPIGRFSCNSPDLFLVAQPGGAVVFQDRT